MSVKIRLTRTGRHKDPCYRIVASDTRTARDGAYLDLIGTYNPDKGLEGAEINEEKALSWLNRGAIPSDSVKAMLSEKGIIAKWKAGKK